MFRLVPTLFLVLLLGPATAAAQSGVKLAWDASPDPEVVGYMLAYGTSSGNHSKTIDVGNRTDYVVQGPAGEATFYFVVRAYDSKRVVSRPSNEIILEPCTMAFSTSGQVFGAQPGAGGFTVKTGATCDWSLGSNADWISLNSSSGTGTKALGYTMAANPLRTPRVAILYSGNRSITITQGGRVRSDLDGDGRNDLIWQNHSTGEVSVWRMRGPELARGDYLAPGNVGDTNWKIMGTLDADRDGYTDILFQHDHGEVAIWRMAGETRIENVMLECVRCRRPTQRVDYRRRPTMAHRRHRGHGSRRLR